MTFLRVAGFSLLVLLSYTLFANVVPQVESNPPAEEVVDTGALDRAGQIAWGERLFAGRGTCTLCHNELGRAPNLLATDLGRAIAERLGDPRYAGVARGKDGAAAIEAYVRESLIEPSAFVVAGFGKKGTNDTVSPMPNVAGAPISLSSDEIDALIAFLQSRAGTPVTVPLPSEAAAPAPTAEAGEAEVVAASAEQAVEKFGCSACHDLFSSGAEVGPALMGASQRLGPEGLRRAILDPNAEIVQGFEPNLMPPDYGQQMRVSELDLLIDYLTTLPAPEAGP